MIGNQLKELRSVTKRTQAEVAEHLEISRAAYSHFENNRNEPDNDMLAKLADYFHVTTDYLLGRDGKEENQEQNADLASDDVIFTYEGKPIPKEDLELIRRLMRGTRNDI